MVDVDAAGRRWQRYAITYRSDEMACLADWIRRGMSGSVVGPGGAGKSNLIGFLCGRPDALQRHLGPDAGAALAVLVDLNDLPADDLATFHRAILRAFHEARGRLAPEAQDLIASLYTEHRAVRDPFVTQSALREWLFALTGQGLRVALVLDRFDRFCADPPPRLMDTLRALRDTFKGQLVYLAGMRQPVRYLADPARLGELYEVLDTHVCWVGAMAEEDALRLVAEELGPATAATVGARILALTGGYPALLKAVCHAWPPPGDGADTDEAVAALREDPGVRFRLTELWEGLTQAEQAAMAELCRLAERSAAAVRSGADTGAVQSVVARARERLAAQHDRALVDLAARRLCRRAEGGWAVNGALLAAYIATVAVPSRGTIWRDAATGELYQGQVVLGNLANLEARLLSFLLSQPRTRHTKTSVIEQVWPDDAVAEGVMDDALYQVVKELRRKIEPDAARPRYLVTWRGKPEGGYQFFPEGRPAG